VLFTYYFTNYLQSPFAFNTRAFGHAGARAPARVDYPARRNTQCDQLNMK